jgi:shikimate dehydrogenase
MFPDTENCPDLEYSRITDQHLAYDLIYNPEKTLFMRRCEEQGATIMNGRKMLELQAEKAWEIWNS